MGPEHPMSESDNRVLVVGAGPVGLSLALGLAHHGIRSTIVERNASISERSKAPGIHARTLEIFQQWGVADGILAEGNLLTSVTPHSARTGEPVLTLPLDELREECRFPGLCILEQGRTERVLLDAVRATGYCDVRFDHELRRFEESEGGVRATMNTGDAESVLAARYLVGCDGAGSTVRDLLGVPFRGITYPVDAVLADVSFDDERAHLPFPRLASDGRRIMFCLRLESGSWRLVAADPASTEEIEPESTVDESLIRDLVALLWGPGEFETEWSSRFQLHKRCASRFRSGRVLLAGDAAHVNSPVGAQGMNSGIHDAHNLAWKLAAALRGGDEDSLLDSYDIERRDLVLREVNRVTDVMTRAVLAPASLQTVAVAVAKRLVRLRALRGALMRRATMLAPRYRESPLLSSARAPVGRRVPDVELEGSEGARRLHDLIGSGPALLVLDSPLRTLGSAFDGPTIVLGERGWEDRSGILARRLGTRGVLVVRPDHFVGWAGVVQDAGDLERAVATATGHSLT
jgi:2-polyprenyl-6-methoxyphenol hydroxylase-like FAD-dependent oxidoreductase